MEPLTKKQEEIYHFIEQFIEESGYSPTIREICGYMNLNSTATVWVHLMKMKKKQYIDFEKRKPRTIKLLERR